jgi:NTP pyrophosphatase (non-canonical NTP hydrolase)
MSNEPTPTSVTEAEYPHLALRTCCPDASIDTTRVDAPLFIRILESYVEASKRLDILKKVTVYGKDLPGMGSDNGFKLPANMDPQVYHAILGIATEGGELVEALLKGLLAGGAHVDRTNIKEELGDLEWFEALLRSRIGFSATEVRTANIQKLEARYAKKKFEAEAALNRDHAAEREALG